MNTANNVLILDINDLIDKSKEPTLENIKMGIEFKFADIVMYNDRLGTHILKNRWGHTGKIS